jgi:hypothetical protein
VPCCDTVLKTRYGLVEIQGVHRERGYFLSFLCFLIRQRYLTGGTRDWRLFPGRLAVLDTFQALVTGIRCLLHA